MASFDGFTQELGAIGVGAGRQVLPAPVIPTSYNELIRSYSTRDFSWNAVQANPIETDSGAVGIPVAGEYADSYILEITPNLGWVTKEELFEPYLLDQSDAGNALLRRFTNLKVGDGLTSSTIADTPADARLIYTVPQVDFIKLIDPKYKEYLWRVVAARADGIEGFPSVIQRFIARVEIVDLDWTIDPIDEPVNALTISLGGSKAPNISSIEINNSTRNTTVHSSTRWSAEIAITGNNNEIIARAVDTKGNASVYKILNIEASKSDQSYQAVWNTFDEFGLLVDTNRIPQETNTGYRDRLLDAYTHRAGPRYKGLVNGVTRELGLSYNDTGIVVLPAAGQYSKEDAPGIFITNGHQYMQVDSDLFVNTREHHTLDPWDWSITLDNTPIEDNLIIESPIGKEIKSRNRWVVDRDKSKVVFRNNDLINAPIYATYRYAERFNKTSKTIQDVVNWLNALAKNGESVVSASVDSALDTSTSASYLALFPRTVVTRNNYPTFGDGTNLGLPIRWSNFYIRSLNDTEFLDGHLNSMNNHFGTDIERWAHLLQSMVHTQWGFAVADRNVWADPENPLIGVVSLPTTYDPHLAHWEGTNPVGSVQYTTPQAHGLNYLSMTDGSDLKYKGIPSAMVKSGIGDSKDLLVKVISEKASQIVQSQGEIITTIRAQVTTSTDSEGNLIVNTGGELPEGGILEP